MAAKDIQKPMGCTTNIFMKTLKALSAQKTLKKTRTLWRKKKLICLTPIFGSLGGIKRICKKQTGETG